MLRFMKRRRLKRGEFLLDPRRGSKRNMESLLLLTNIGKKMTLCIWPQGVRRLLFTL
jgi:hypothetical protein